MAKTRINIEDEVRDSATSIEESTIEQAAIKENDFPTATISTIKNVKIRVIEDIDCIIACKPYRIAKDKEASVPSDVAAILCYAKKAYKL